MLAVDGSRLRHWPRGICSIHRWRRTFLQGCSPRSILRLVEWRDDRANARRGVRPLGCRSVALAHRSGTDHLCVVARGDPTPPAPVGWRSPGTCRLHGTANSGCRGAFGAKTAHGRCCVSRRISSFGASDGETILFVRIDGTGSRFHLDSFGAVGRANVAGWSDDLNPGERDVSGGTYGWIRVGQPDGLVAAVSLRTSPPATSPCGGRGATRRSPSKISNS